MNDHFFAPQALETSLPSTLPDGPAKPSMPEGYAMFDDGIYSVNLEDQESPAKVCSPLRIDALFSDTAGKGWGKLVSVRAPDGEWHAVPVTSRELTGRFSDVLGRLADHGLELAPGRKSKAMLEELLSTWTTKEKLTAVTRTGWVPGGEPTFVISDEVIGKRPVLSMIASSSTSAQRSPTAGTLESWRNKVGEKCRDNPMMILAVSLAFSGPLLALTGMTGGGLHYRGTSSSGKTTLIHLATSVWGSRDLIHQWRATSNGLEGIATTMNDMLLPLDEIGEIAGKALGESIYMLANGTGKVRMTKEATVKETERWRLALISSGEISVAEKLAESRQCARLGHEVRLIDIEADGRAHGVFDSLNGSSRGGEFADSIRAAAAENFGTVGREFVRILGAEWDAISRTVKPHMRKFQTEASGSLGLEADGSSHRVCERFALLAFAGEVATMMKLTGWEKGSARAASMQAFREWHDRQFGERIDRVKRFIQPMQVFLSTRLHELSNVGTGAPATISLGWTDKTHAYLTPDTWFSIYPGPHAKEAASAMLDLQMLLAGDGGRATKKAPRAVPDRPRLYTVNIERVLTFRPE